MQNTRSSFYWNKRKVQYLKIIYRQNTKLKAKHYFFSCYIPDPYSFLSAWNRFNSIHYLPFCHRKFFSCYFPPGLIVLTFLEEWQFLPVSISNKSFIFYFYFYMRTSGWTTSIKELCDRRLGIAENNLMPSQDLK